MSDKYTKIQIRRIKDISEDLDTTAYAEIVPSYGEFVFSHNTASSKPKDELVIGDGDTVLPSLPRLRLYDINNIGKTFILPDNISAENPVYAVYKPSTDGVGAPNKFIYVSDTGSVVASAASIGNSAVPVYVNNGTVTTCSGGSLFNSLTISDGTNNVNKVSATIAGYTRTANIPAASNANSGVITTEAQTFAGLKTFQANAITINANAQYPGLQFKSQNSIEDRLGSMRFNFGGSTPNMSQAYIEERSFNSSGTPTNYFENYRLPIPTVGMTSDASYDILTTKSPVTIAQGGTGLSSNPSMLVNLASTSADTVFKTTPRPGITGTLPASHGGTGQTSLVNASNSLLNALSTGSSTPEDGDYYISQYAGGGTTTTTYHRRPMSALWSYIKDKTDDIYALKSHNHSASDITSGTLSVARGGTGISTMSYKNAVLIGNSSTVTSAMQPIRTGSGAFYATAQDGKPQFGVLPVAQGGTGKSSGTIPRVTVATAAPSTKETGDFYFNSNTGVLQIYTGSAWKSVVGVWG